MNRSNQKGIALILTLILGCVFLSLKYVEYHEKWVDHHIPGPGFQYADPRYFHQAQILFFLYFAMTGMHAIHMIVGAGLLTALIVTFPAVTLPLPTPAVLNAV